MNDAIPLKMIRVYWVLVRKISPIVVAMATLWVLEAHRTLKNQRLEKAQRSGVSVKLENQNNHDRHKGAILALDTMITGAILVAERSKGHALEVFLCARIPTPVELTMGDLPKFLACARIANMALYDWVSGSCGCRKDLEPLKPLFKGRG